MEYRHTAYPTRRSRLRHTPSSYIRDPQEHARAALSLPRHKAAARIARDTYETFRLERYQVTWDQPGQQVDFRLA